MRTTDDDRQGLTRQSLRRANIYTTTSPRTAPMHARMISFTAPKPKKDDVTVFLGVQSFRRKSKNASTTRRTMPSAPPARTIIETPTAITPKDWPAHRVFAGATTRFSPTRTSMDKPLATETLFELSHPGRRCHRLPACDVPRRPLGDFCRRPRWPPPRRRCRRSARSTWSATSPTCPRGTCRSTRTSIRSARAR